MRRFYPSPAVDSMAPLQDSRDKDLGVGDSDGHQLGSEALGGGGNSAWFWSYGLKLASLPSGSDPLSRAPGLPAGSILPRAHPQRTCRRTQSTAGGKGCGCRRSQSSPERCTRPATSTLLKMRTLSMSPSNFFHTFSSVPALLPTPLPHCSYPPLLPVPA